MSNLNKRLGKIEKHLHIGEKPHLVNIAGLKMTSDDLKKIFKMIDGKTKGVLPSINEKYEK